MPRTLGPPRKRLSFRKKVVFSLALVPIAFLLLEGLSSTVLAWRKAHWERHRITEQVHSEYDPDLGWRSLKSHHARDLYGPEKHYTTNDRGFRGAAPLTKEVPDGKFRIVCLGDSFTAGYGVGDGHSFPAQIQDRCDDLQTVNMGMGGYGVDQCYLWYLCDGVKLDADLLVFAFIVSDFHRMQTDRFIGRYPKPVLAVEDGALVVRNVPVPSYWAAADTWHALDTFMAELSLPRVVGKAAGLLRQSAPARAVDDDAMSFKGPAEKVFADLDRVCKQRGQRFALVLLPISYDAPYADVVASWLETAARRMQLEFIDLAALFSVVPEEHKSRFFMWHGHYTEAGNARVASALLTKLRKRFREFPRH